MKRQKMLFYSVFCWVLFFLVKVCFAFKQVASRIQPCGSNQHKKPFWGALLLTWLWGIMYSFFPYRTS